MADKITKQDQSENSPSGELDLGVMDIHHVELCNNLNIFVMVHQCDIILVQLSQCPSAKGTRLLGADYRIMEREHNELVGWYDVAKAAKVAPQYMPSYDPTPLHVPMPPAVKRVNNPHLQDYMNFTVALRTQMLISPNQKQPTRVQTHEITEVYDPYFEDMGRHLEYAKEHVGNPQWTPELDSPQTGENPGTPR